MPTRVSVDDDRIVPDEGWQRFEIDRDGTSESYAPALLSAEIARQVVSAWLGDRPDTLRDVFSRLHALLESQAAGQAA